MRITEGQLRKIIREEATSVLREGDASSVLYTGIVLDDAEGLRSLIDKRGFGRDIDGWETSNIGVHGHEQLNHHMTIAIGELKRDNPLRDALDVEFPLQVIGWGVDPDLGVAAWQVDPLGIPVKTGNPHITAALRDSSVKPFMASKIKNWTPLAKPFMIVGHLQEVRPRSREPRITENQLRRIIREVLESPPDTRRKIFVLVGPPSIGKSTWIRKTFRDIDPYIISRDDVVDAVAASFGWTYDDMFEAPPKDAELGDMHEKYGEVIKSPPYMTWQPLSYSEVLRANSEIQSEHAARIAAAVDSGLDIVVDMTNMLARSRQSALAAIKGRENEFTKIAVVFPFQGAEDVVKRVSAMRAADIKAKGGSKTIPPSAMDRMMSTYEDVSPAEGFDEVIEFDNRPALRALIDG